MQHLPMFSKTICCQGCDSSHKNTKAVHLLLIFSMNCSTDATAFTLKE